MSDGHTVIAIRRAGQLLGDAGLYTRDLKAPTTWHTDIKARGPVRVLLMHRKDMRALIARRPEVEADIHAVVSQRKAETLKLETLEQLASLHRDMVEEVAATSKMLPASVDDLTCALPYRQHPPPTRQTSLGA